MTDTSEEKMQRKKIFKTGIFIICLIAAAYFGVRMAFLMSAPFQHVNTGKEIDRVEVNNGNVIINVLVMGLDKDETRTDTLIFMSYNSANGKCFMMSIPRDTYVHINGNRVLINEAYTHGGAEATIKKVKELINLPVNYYVVFTFQDFRDVIDGLGGVEFDVRPQGYHYDDPYQDLHINIPGGHQVLDGEKAEGLVRFRNDYAMADLDRVEVQRQFVKAVIEQKLNKKYIRAIPKIYASLSDSLKSNLSLDEILDYSKEILSAGVTSFDMYTMPYTISGMHVLPDEEGIKAIVDQYKADSQAALVENEQK